MIDVSNQIEQEEIEPKIPSPTLKPLILCVDDEKIILDSLKLQLQSYFDESCVVELAESGEEGLGIIDELIESGYEYPHVIISDQIMPRMKGDEFLSKANDKCPESLRILLTGQADKDDIINAINKAGLYRYIPKPWDHMDLNLTVKEALLSYTQTKKIENQRDELLVLNHSLEEKVTERTKALKHEKTKADNLLLNILPDEIVEELKENGAVTPKHYELATIAFLDIVGFTILGKNLSPQEMINQLNVIFHDVDEVVEEFDLEKIKTLGDGYMFAGGVPVQNSSNPVDVVASCIRITERMTELRQKNLDMGMPGWDIRIGIHSGELVAGVIGKKKFAYDVWGTTVNTASRIESSGDAGKINISKATYDLVKDHFECEHRGEISMKNMGELDMYYVVGAKTNRK